MSTWGDSRDKQISARFNGECDVPIVHKPRKFLGITLRGERTVTESRYVNLEDDQIPDDLECYRTFEHTCGLIKVVNVLASTSSTMVLYLDGFSNVEINIGNTYFVFNPTLEQPTATVRFHGHCTRRGKMAYGRTDEYVTLTFRDEAQLREYLIATTSAPKPEVARSSSTTHFRTDSGGNSMWPLAAAIVLGVAITS